MYHLSVKEGLSKQGLRNNVKFPKILHPDCRHSGSIRQEIDFCFIQGESFSSLLPITRDWTTITVVLPERSIHAHACMLQKIALKKA